jgi:hypothetical protein
MKEGFILKMILEATVSTWIQTPSGSSRVLTQQLLINTSYVTRVLK